MSLLFFSLMTLLNCTLCRQQIFELLHLYECYSKPKFCALEKLTKFGSGGWKHENEAIAYLLPYKISTLLSAFVSRENGGVGYNFHCFSVIAALFLFEAYAVKYDCDTEMDERMIRTVWLVDCYFLRSTQVLLHFTYCF